MEENARKIKMQDKVFHSSKGGFPLIITNCQETAEVHFIASLIIKISSEQIKTVKNVFCSSTESIKGLSL